MEENRATIMLKSVVNWYFETLLKLEGSHRNVNCEENIFSGTIKNTIYNFLATHLCYLWITSDVNSVLYM